MPIICLTYHTSHDSQWFQACWMKLSHHEVFSRPRSFFRNVQSWNVASVSCEKQVPDKHAVGKLVFSFHFGIKFLTIMQSGIGRSIFFQIQASDNHAVRNWTFWSCNNHIFFSSGSRFWQSCSQEFEAHFLFKSKLLTIMQSGFDILVFCNNHISLRILGTRVICLPWVVGLQGDRHLYRLIQAASTGVNLLLWRHLGTKAKERPVTMLFPHYRGPYVTLSTTAICGEFWETFATGRATSRQWKSLLSKWRPPIGTLCYWTNLLSRSS